MLTKKPYLRLVKYISVASVLLLLLASDCVYNLRTAAEPREGGTVLQFPEADGKGEISHDDPVRLEAVPNLGFRFSHWEETGDVSPILEFRMGKSDIFRTAVFVPNA
ncbi:MAG: hypothetical protein J4N78_14425, partial [Chloroflexi bacterium]|nr:hypothetical protein [Chloroflexota bacterium]